MFYNTSVVISAFEKMASQVEGATTFTADPAGIPPLDTDLDSEDEEEVSGDESVFTYDEDEELDDDISDKNYVPEGSESSAPSSPEEARSHSPPHTPRKETLPRVRSGRTRNISRGQSRTRSRSPLEARPQSGASTTSWKTEKDPDVCPEPVKFSPARPPGHQLRSTLKYTPLDLFKLFFNKDAVKTICENTNKQAVKNIANGKKYYWTDINEEEFYKFVGLIFFFSLVKLSTIQDYWKRNTIFSVAFPASVMPRERYRVISWNVHMSDPAKDVENDSKKGTPDYDRLFRLKPLMNTIKDACKRYYQPRQNLSIDERMVATKAHTGMTQYVKAKPTKWGFKLFVLADSSNGYTLDFNIYTGRSRSKSGAGIGYDSVMSLVQSADLSSGSHLYMDNFYTSPKLFKDLFSRNIGACGTYRDNKRGCPSAPSNALKKKDSRGSIRWIREDPLLFVKWLDTREMAICSTIHQAFSGSSVNRRVKGPNGKWTTKSVPCPTSVIEYNKYMRGVDLSDQLIQYYSVNHRTMRWYRTLFLHFLDIAATNSYLLYKELCKEKQQFGPKDEEPMTHRAFLETLTAQLCGVTVTAPPAKAHSDHIPVPVSNQTDISKRASYGRKSCVNCRQTRGVLLSTPWKCKACDVALCLIANRNCFEAWHS